MAVVLCAIGTLLGTWRFTWLTGSLGVQLLDYSRPNIVLMSVASFLILASAPVRQWLAVHPGFVKLARDGAVLSFGVYLIHPLLLQVAVPRLGLSWNRFSPLVCIPVSFCVLLAMSILAVVLLRRIPFLRAAVS